MIELSEASERLARGPVDGETLEEGREYEEQEKGTKMSDPRSVTIGTRVTREIG